MSKLEIKKYGTAVLRQKAEPVKEINNSIRALAADMLETMYEGRGVGLAANQVGVPRRIAVVDVKWTQGEKSPVVLINPEIISQSGEAVAEEGCLSFPGITAKIRRPDRVEVSALDLDGKKRVVSCKGLFSRAVCHELDHLNGVLFIDRMNPVTKLTLRKKINRLKKQDGK